MKRLEHTISRLNELSDDILSELEKEAPSLEAIREGMNQREEHLKVLSIIQNNKKEMELSEQEVKTLRPLFDAFIGMNDEIQQRISTLLNNQLEKHERIKKIVILKDTWSTENNFLTPTLKIKRNIIDEKYKKFYEAWFDSENKIVFQ